MKFFRTNLIDASGVIFTPTSEVSTLPASNLAHEFRKKVWRTGATSATERVVIDLGSAQTVTSIILLDHTLTFADSNILLEGNATDAWGGPSFSRTLTWASGTIGETFLGQTLRYWRLSFTKSSATESRDIGRLYLGDYYQTTEQPEWSGYDQTLDDLARQQVSLAGQVWTEAVDRRYLLKCDFGKTPETMMSGLKAIFDSVGNTTPFFIQVDTVSPLDKFFYVRLDKAFKEEVAGFDSQLYWNCSLAFKEQV